MRLLDETLSTRGAPARYGTPVDLEPVFAGIFLGAETARLERLLAETVTRGLIREASGLRCYSLTVPGATAARGARRRPRWIAVTVVSALLAAIVALLMLV